MTTINQKEKAPSIKKNFIYNTLYEILAIISPIITAPYVSRIFEADGVGVYSYTLAICSYFTMFAALGVKSYGQREIARCREDRKAASKLFWELELMCISTTLLCSIVWLFLIIFSSNYSVYYAVLTITLAATALDISWFWAGYEEYRFIVIRNSIIKIIGIVLLFTCVHKKSDLLLYVLLIAVIGFIGNLSMWTYLPKYLQKVSINELSLKRHYKETLVYFVPTIVTSIYTILDKAMIGWITKSDYENGYYEQATKILNICKALVFSIITVVSSRMSFLFAKGENNEIKDRLNNTIDFVMLFAIPIMFGLIGIADRFVPFFFGEGYEASIFILVILSALLPIVGISNSLGSLYFTPSGQRARSNKAIITGAVVNVVLNVTLIPFFKSTGAAVASVIAELTITCMYLYMARDYFDVKQIVKVSWKRLIAASIMMVAVLLIGKWIDNALLCIVLQSIAGVVSYGVLLLCLRDDFLIENTSKILKKVFRK